MPLDRTPFTLFEPFELTPRKTVRRRFLKFDMNALADFEQMTGMGFGQLMQMKAVFATARAMLWAGLKHEDRTLTVEKVGDLLSQYIRGDKERGVPAGGIDEILTKCFEAARDQGAFGPLAADEEEGGESEPGNDLATIEVKPS